MKSEVDLELCRIVAESADRLVSTQVYGSGGAASLTNRNLTLALYESARKLQKEPLSYLAASALVERVKPRDVVLICTGFFDPPSMIDESDGPVGAVHLARALCVAFDATPVFLTEVANMDRMAQLARSAGLDVIDLPTARTTPFKAAVAPVPIDPARARKQAGRLMKDAAPAAMISIEKPAPSPAGRYHTGVGLDVTDTLGKVDYFVDAAQAAGVLTIGIGDGGNEVGLGCILDDVIDIVPGGDKIGAATKTDILIVATIANWGAYAIEACLAAALHKPEIIHSLAEERRVTDGSVNAGFIDPATGMPNGWIDGTPPVCSESILELLRQMVELRLSARYRENSMLNFPRRWLASGVAEDTVKLWAGKLAAAEDAYFSEREE
jgi:D-glutamate cyclase